eukprot:911304-Ditylum_brightwellii.AAC.1
MNVKKEKKACDILTGQIFMGMDSDVFDINGQKPRQTIRQMELPILAEHGNVVEWDLKGFLPLHNGCCCIGNDGKMTGTTHKEQRDELVRVLHIILNWRMQKNAPMTNKRRFAS